MSSARQRYRLVGVVLSLGLGLGFSAAALAMTPAEVGARVGIEPRLGARLPMALPLREADGRTLTLGQILHGLPLALMFGYYHCRTLCETSLDGFARTLDAGGLQPGRDLTAVFIGIDPREPAADARLKHGAYARAYPRVATDDWHFLLGVNGSEATLADAAGFRYAYDARMDQYAHATGVLIADPGGRITALLPGVAISPTALRQALDAAAHGEVATTAQPLLQVCYHYLGQLSGRGLMAQRLVQGFALATVFGMVLLVGWLTAHRRRSARP